MNWDPLASSQLACTTLKEVRRKAFVEAEMSEKLLREEMYDLVWATPVKTLSIRFGMSDVA